MRLHRFFIPAGAAPFSVGQQAAVADAGLAHQLKSVFRMKPGDEAVLLDGSGFEYVAEIVSMQKADVIFKIIDSKKSQYMAARDVWLFCSLIKKDNFEWVAEKGTELGVSHFVPIVSERSEKKDINRERLVKIIKEASEQSGRSTMPELLEPVMLPEALEISKEKNREAVAFHTSGEIFAMPEESSGAIGAFIGPEGGWSDAEIALFKDAGVPTRTLGSQVLRAETAAIAVATLLLLFLY